MSREARAALRTEPCNCTVLVHQHVRKCAGVALRSMFDAHKAALGQRNAPFWCPSSLDAFASRWAEGPSPPPDAPTLHVWEKHCGTHALAPIARSVSALAAPTGALRGCQLFSLSVLREPVRLLESDFYFFVNDDDHVNVSLLEFAELNPEAMLFEGTAANLGVPLPAPGPSAPAQLRALHARLLHARSDLAARRRDPAAREAKRAWLTGRAVGDRIEHAQIAPKLDGGPWARDRELALDALRVRASYLRALRAAGRIDCAQIAARVVTQLARIFDVVGVSERLAETVLLVADEVGLRALPPIGAMNSHGHPTLSEGSSAYGRIASLNECSLRVYDTVRAAFDARVAALGKPFAARAAAVRAEIDARRGCGQLFPVIKYATINASPKQLAAGVPDGRACEQLVPRHHRPPRAGASKRQRGPTQASAARRARPGHAVARQ